MDEMIVKVAEIRDKLGIEELLAQLAEEATELAQAALKLRRAIGGENPTPKTEGNCRKALIEELSDVYVCQLAAQVYPDLNVICEKVERWHKRLTESEGTE